MLKIDLHQKLQGLHVFERGWLSANNILFMDGDKTLLIDSGYCTHAVQTRQLMESVLGQRPLDILVNTHLHSDHCGGNAELQQRYAGLQTLIPPGQSQHVANWDAVPLTYVPTGQLCPPFRFDDTLRPGTSMQFGADSWQVHAAPGHDPHSVIFFEPARKILISADALWESGFGVVFPELEGEDAFGEVGATLDLIESLKPDIVIPGHGPVFNYTPAILARARQRLDAFTADPRRHAQHAAKVLLKFKLLEVQQQTFEDFMRWAEATPYLAQLWARFFADLDIHIWLEQLSADLAAAGAARREGAVIVNA